jgi:serine/threonine-protein kinase SRK2
MVQYVTKRRETKASRGGLCMDEDEARYYFLQLLSAVEYCHKHHVAHRDLKLDNTLLDGHQPAWIKLCDFGFAKHWLQTSNMNTMRIGTPEYMGPELISSRTGYDGVKVDIWAAGVLLYVMLVGMFPFETQDDNYNNTAGLYDIWLQQVCGVLKMWEGSRTGFDCKCLLILSCRSKLAGEIHPITAVPSLS